MRSASSGRDRSGVAVPAACARCLPGGRVVICRRGDRPPYGGVVPSIVIDVAGFEGAIGVRRRCCGGRDMIIDNEGVRESGGRIRDELTRCRGAEEFTFEEFRTGRRRGREEGTGGGVGGHIACCCNIGLNKLASDSIITCCHSVIKCKLRLGIQFGK
jgi:hypothetical protein